MGKLGGGSHGGGYGGGGGYPQQQVVYAQAPPKKSGGIGMGGLALGGSYRAIDISNVMLLLIIFVQPVPVYWEVYFSPMPLTTTTTTMEVVSAGIEYPSFLV